MPKRYRGKTWDELEVGQEFWTGARTVTESDVLTYAGLSGDFNPLHVDEEFAKTVGPFGVRIPHAPLFVDFYLGLLDQLGIVRGTALAFLELRWKFLSPVIMGDTVHARITVQSKREVKKPDRGVVTLAITMFNQKEEPVQEGEQILWLIRRHPESS